MTEPLSILTALMLGLFGASHCLVMCGGIAAAAGHAGGKHKIRAAVLFNVGRLTSYTFAGFIVGYAGLWLGEQHQILMLTLRTIAGTMLILMGLYVAKWATWLTQVEKLGQGLWRFIQPSAQKRLGKTDMPSQLILGMLWGWLPCGLIYSTLSWVAANGSPIDGALAMLAFGAGTLPAIFSATLASATIMSFINHKFVRAIAALLLIGYGVWTLISAWYMVLMQA
jgi:sulfite exporter TauE/SafE